MKAKHTMIVAAALGLAVSGISTGQETKTSDPKLDQGTNETVDTAEMSKPQIVVKDGKPMVMKGEEWVAMEEDMELPNGTVVMKDGTYKTKDGKVMMLASGDMMTMEGEMTMGDHIMMKDGKVMTVKGGKPMMMDADMELANGTKVMQDGKVMTKAGETMMLEEGDMISMGGVWVKGSDISDIKKPFEKH